MSNGHSLMKTFSTIGLILALGVSMSAGAGLFGFGGDNWKEEVLLHDGSKIIAQRSLSYGGRREIGQGAPIKEQDITFTLPNTNKTISFKSEFGDDVGRANFDLLALHILNGTPYIVAEPVGCFSYNKWGRPNPPYVFFKYDGKAWQRILLSAFPVEFKTLNLAIYLGHQNVEAMVKEGLVPAEDIKKRNSELTQYPQYQSILREAYPGVAGSCSEMIYDGKGGWYGIDFFSDQPSYEACVKFCAQKKISPQYCPCKTLFKGEK